jgi:hypothetical protein
MAEACPDRSVLESYARGQLPEDARSSLEAHLDGCLICAEAIERLTRSELESLIGDSQAEAIETAPSRHNPILDRVMLSATEAQPTIATPTEAQPDDIRRILDPPVEQGDLGSFAGYDILEIAGRGGMGVVFKAWDRTLQRIVALKVIIPKRASDSAIAARWLAEARTVAALQHDHIVAVHHAGMAKDLPFLLMPFHGEGTLARFLATRRILPARDVIQVGLQLARALAATHSRGILHRDIKPSNVLLERGLERVRLADFGLARQTRDDGSAASPRPSVAGTPDYMSPEQARGDEIDARSDLFSLGAMLYHLASGQTIYAAKTSSEALRLAARGEPPRLRATNPKVPVRLAAIIDRLLSRRPADRHGSATELASELERLTQTKGPFRRRVLRTLLTAAAACLTLAAGIAILDWTGQTAIVNTLLSGRNGHSYYIRGRFGTYPLLSSAVAMARPHDVIEVRFSGEQLVSLFRTGGRPLTIRAAKGFAPILVAKNNAQPIILVDAPLTLEGLTLCRRGPRPNFAPLVSVESAPLHLLNCRILRVQLQAPIILAQGRFRLSPATGLSSTRALLAFQHGSVGHLRNCVIAGTQASAIGLRGSTNQPTRIEADHNLFVVERTFTMKPEPATKVALRSVRNVLVTGGLLELDESGPLSGLTVQWESSFLERSPGGFLRVNQSHEGALMRRLDWRETNVVYGGQGVLAVSREGRQLASEARWSEMLELGSDSHRLTDRQAFPATCFRSTLTVSAADLDTEVLRDVLGDTVKTQPEHIGDGEPYFRFRRTDGYRQWQRDVAASAREWEQRPRTPSRE